MKKLIAVLVLCGAGLSYSQGIDRSIDFPWKDQGVMTIDAGNGAKKYRYEKLDGNNLKVEAKAINSLLGMLQYQNELLEDYIEHIRELEIQVKEMSKRTDKSCA